eukprot:CAMPEP_0202383998 /NCGR_PEP_ID=MMETSP1127-20130417/52544_1 /ASSEMBLY_ACC=CAM_ASM_000462 /TAXON_ID=3047 /ORGANISM="Dunaliella tertiolecta, Strain CCMP1320" /LENGTH=58 /DNA_ID=CAMNT_0048983645 /DNA_START=21 /DNA_END=197 /DNA_ORIENTATION=-
MAAPVYCQCLPRVATVQCSLKRGVLGQSSQQHQGGVAQAHAQQSMGGGSGRQAAAGAA